MKSLTVKSLLALILIGLCSFTIYLSKKPVKKHYDEGVNKNQSLNINIKIDDLHPGIQIPNDFLGLSYEITSLTDSVYFRSNHVKFKNLMAGLGNGVLRLNGYYGNFVPWGNHERNAIMSKGSNYYLTDSIATSDLDSVFAFVRPIGWKVILGIQLPHSTPERTHDEVSYAWRKGSDVIKAFEIGNEPEGLYKSNFANYYNDLSPHISIIKNKLPPNVPICGPASVHPDLFIAPFINKFYNRVSFITYHDYPVGENNVKNNVGQLLGNNAVITAYNKSHFVDSLSRIKNVKYRISECNNYADEGSGVADRFASALWGIDFMFTVAQNNAQGINFHGGGRGFTPISVNKGKVIEPQPLYYGMLFFHLASQGQLLPIKSNSSNTAIKAYAVLGKNQTIFLTLLNKDPYNSATINIATKSSYGTGKVIQLLAPSVSSKDSITMGGSSINRLGVWKAKSEETILPQHGSFNINIPAGSATLVTLPRQ
ncbi:glycosyl hydrolase family 79 [Mucilaginibacter frigoritolerans]|uniref:Glycosyl hydrolase family 79 n=1 Tax=Mucilaginibacter frigoritolerans TaxID=652788 RepID=A0A562UGW3_9SPHI|nr:glycosyl hydrolase family 79 C-terminal domain-containing protein [Mucilaginibacter frigoritolerans]TWJ04627.1 glycosyl hydrolase family 79 [Mucilaginibacter frigoritolerans]